MGGGGPAGPGPDPYIVSQQVVNVRMLALVVEHRFRGIELQADIVTFNAAISACEKSNLWQEAWKVSDGEFFSKVDG